MKATHVQRTMDILCHYYSDREGNARKLNPVQATVYADGLSRFSDVDLEGAARRWMRQSKFFPALSELLELLEPAIGVDDMAQLAWARLEQEIRHIGAYRSVQFTDAVFGVAVRETFGSWAQACRFDMDSPGWAIRRQTFLAAFRTAFTRRHDGPPVMLSGLHREQTPVLVGHLEGLPPPAAIEAAGTNRAPDVLAEVERRRLDRAQASSWNAQ